jgi:hypothetical protein
VKLYRLLPKKVLPVIAGLDDACSADPMSAPGPSIQANPYNEQFSTPPISGHIRRQTMSCYPSTGSPQTNGAIGNTCSGSRTDLTLLPSRVF